MYDYHGGDARDAAVGSFSSKSIGTSGYPSEACVLKENGNVDCLNISSGYSTFASWDTLYSGGDADKVTMGQGHVCVLKNNGNVNCWGDNSHGQASDKTNADYNVLDVSASADYTCVAEEYVGSLGLFNSDGVDCYGKSDYLPNELNSYYRGSYKEVSTASSHICIRDGNGNVECYGDSGSDWGQFKDYNNGNAKEVSAGLFSTCILKNNGNVECYGCTTKDCSRGGSSNHYKYTKGDAVDMASGGENAPYNAYPYRFQCVMDSSKNVSCFESNGNKVAGTDYSCNLPPRYSGYSFSSSRINNDKVKIQTSVNWNDPESNFNYSYLEHNISGNPKNITSSSTSHSFSKEISNVGTYYVRFYGDDKAGLSNKTGKKVFNVYEATSKSGSFHWEDTSGNEISSVSITDSKNVTMVANYSSQDPAGSNTVSFDVYGDGNSLTTKSGVSVQSIGGSDYAEKEVNITSSWTSSYSDLHFNVSGEKSGDLTVYCQNCGSGGGQTCPTTKTNISCVSSSSDCGGSLLTGESCTSGVCCNASVSSGGGPKICGNITSCSDYNNSQDCNNNACNVVPNKDLGFCTGTNCGCSWNSTSDQCYLKVDNYSSDGASGDGTCYFEDNRSGSCEAPGPIKYSYEPKKYVNSTGTYTGKVASKECSSGYRTITCPSVAKLPAENGFTIPLTILALTLAYVVYWNRREE